MKFLLLVTLTTIFSACWYRSPSRIPEECKVTTDPEACRKSYSR